MGVFDGIGQKWNQYSKWMGQQGLEWYDPLLIAGTGGAGIQLIAAREAYEKNPFGIKDKVEGFINGPPEKTPTANINSKLDPGRLAGQYADIANKAPPFKQNGLLPPTTNMQNFGLRDRYSNPITGFGANNTTRLLQMLRGGPMGGY